MSRFEAVRKGGGAMDQGADRRGPRQAAGAGAFTSGQRWRSLATVIASAAAAGLTIGLIMPLITLILERDGVDTVLIGLNAAMSALAVVASAPLMPRLIGVLGTLPSMWLGVAVSTGVILLFPVFDTLAAWFVLRFVLGLGLAVHWVVSEAWINTVATERNRGRVIGAYVTLLSAGFAAGPLVVGLVGIDGALPFVVSAVSIAAAGAPLVFARGLAPPMPRGPTASIVGFFRRAPTTMAAALAAGLTFSAAFALLPLYGLRSGFDQQTAVVMLSVFVAGNLALQMPIGWLADRIDRRLLLMGCAAAGIAGPAALPFVIGAPALLWPALFVWGGTVVGLYTVGLTLLGQRFRPIDLAGANVAFVTIFESGSVIGPTAAGAAMDAWDPHGLPLVVGLASAAFVLVAARRHAALRRGAAARDGPGA